MPSLPGFPCKFPSRPNRELFRRNREFCRENREFGAQNPKSSSGEVFGTHTQGFANLGFGRNKSRRPRRARLVFSKVRQWAILSTRGRVAHYYSAASAAAACRLRRGCMEQASSHVRIRSDRANLPTPSVSAHSKANSIISSSLKCLFRSV